MLAAMPIRVSSDPVLENVFPFGANAEILLFVALLDCVVYGCANIDGTSSVMYGKYSAKISLYTSLCFCLHL